MAKVRKIDRRPRNGRNYYLVDACFLANKHINPEYAPRGLDRSRVESCQDWWAEIDQQLANNKARVYVPDVCIAEAFKVLAKKYYSERWFKTYPKYSSAKKKLSADIRMDSKPLKSSNRTVLFHDISTNRDIIISVDRFFELFLKNNINVQIVDLIIIATAKYMMEFYDIPRDQLHIVTLDRPLIRGVAHATDLPNAYDPTLVRQRAELVFR